VTFDDKVGPKINKYRELTDEEEEEIDENVKTAKKFPREKPYSDFRLDSSRSELIEDYDEIIIQNSKHIFENRNKPVQKIKKA
jgi:hypothetical protein